MVSGKNRFQCLARKKNARFPSYLGDSIVGSSVNYNARLDRRRFRQGNVAQNINIDILLQKVGYPFFFLIPVNTIQYENRSCVKGFDLKGNASFWIRELSL